VLLTGFRSLPPLFADTPNAVHELTIASNILPPISTVPPPQKKIFFYVLIFLQALLILLVLRIKADPLSKS